MIRAGIWCVRHRRIALSLWFVALLVVGIPALLTGNRYQTEYVLKGAESTHAAQLLEQNFPQRGGGSVQVVFAARQGSLQGDQVRAEVEATISQIRRLSGVSAVDDVYVGPDARLSPGGSVGFVDVQLDNAKSGHSSRTPLQSIVEMARAANTSNLQAAVATSQLNSDQTQGTGAAEIVGMIVAALVLLIAFRSLLAALLPIVSAAFALGISTALSDLLTNAFPIADFAPSLAALVGLGVGIDYALFIVSRHRGNLLAGMKVDESIERAITLSGRAVLFAGTTVCVAILGLLSVGVGFLNGAAVATSIAVLVSMACALTLLPAFLGFLGIAVLRRSERRRVASDDHPEVAEYSPGWLRWAQFTERHSVKMGLGALVLMLVLSAPTLHIRLGMADSSGDPPGSTTRQAFDLLSRGFGPGFNAPLQLVAPVKTASDINAFDQLLANVSAQPGVASVSQKTVSPSASVVVASVYPKFQPQDARTSRLIHELRTRVIPVTHRSSGINVYVGGETATLADFTTVLSAKIPIFIAAVGVLAFLLLLVVFRTVVIALKATLMNLLSTAAGIGVVVAVFQWGWGLHWIGVSRQGPILPFLPVMLFAILFGLSMDYEIFLITRIREEWLKTGDNNRSTALGQAATGRIITAAAAIMVSVFAAFIFTNSPTIKLFGVGLAASIFLDAVVVRTILVPSLMHLLGKMNWYMPVWLDKLLPKLEIEASDVVDAQDTPEQTSPQTGATTATPRSGWANERSIRQPHGLRQRLR